MPGPDRVRRLGEVRDALEQERQRCTEAQAPLLAERDAIVKQLRVEGWTLRAIAEAAGLRSHRAVQKILEQRPAQAPRPRSSET